MKPHIYFDGDKWRWTMRTARYVQPSTWYVISEYIREMNEKHAMQYFTKG